MVTVCYRSSTCCTEGKPAGFLTRKLSGHSSSCRFPLSGQHDGHCLLSKIDLLHRGQAAWVPYKKALWTLLKLQISAAWAARWSRSAIVARLAAPRASRLGSLQESSLDTPQAADFRCLGSTMVAVRYRSPPCCTEGKPAGFLTRKLSGHSSSCRFPLPGQHDGRGPLS